MMRPGGASDSPPSWKGIATPLCYVAALFLSSAVRAQPASLVKDIYLGAGPQLTRFNHTSLVRSGGLLYFTSDAGGSGTELWKTDGTPSGTALVADLTSGNSPGSNGPTNLTDVNGTLFFTGGDFYSGITLWRTDGTSAGTTLLARLGESESIASLQNVSGNLFFFKFVSSGMELWKSDGTPAGTVLVRAGFAAGTSPSTASVNGVLFFSANDGVNGMELWKSNGTAGGTVLVRDIVAGPAGSGPSNLASVGANLFFSACDDQHGCELWKSDGTAAGTVLVKDINPGPAASFPGALTPFNGFLMFVANDGTYGIELWKSDGTETGTILLRDIRPGPESSYPYALTPGPGALYFAADDGVTGWELWKSDGTPGGTVPVADLLPGSQTSSPANLTLVGPNLYFTALDPSNARQLWKSDGTPGGTSVLKRVSASSLRELQGSLLFWGAEVGPDALWKSDGSPQGTNAFFRFDVPAGSGPGIVFHSGGEVFFAAATFVDDFGLWKTDGTGPGTQMLTSLEPGIDSTPFAEATGAGNRVFFTSNGYLLSTAGAVGDLTVLTAGGVSPYGLTPFGGQLLFGLYRPGYVSADLWITDGTVAGTRMLVSFPTSSVWFRGPLVTVGAEGFFILVNDGHDELWKTDGTSSGTTLVKSLASYYGATNLTTFAGAVYFVVDAFPQATIWKSDGTESGTQSVIPLPGSNLTVVNNVLFFTASHPMTGPELWMTDGTLNGTHLVKDVRPGTEGSNPSQLVGVGNLLYFVADDGVHGFELWRSDGTDAGTSLVADIRSGPDSPLISSLTASGSRVFFTASTIDAGAELWKSDGTEAGTVLVRDINPGSASSSPDSLTDVDGTLYFSAFHPQTGRELWKSDGTSSGTVLVKDIDPSLNSSNPYFGVELGGLLYFSATTAENGSELWSSDGTPAGTILVKDVNPGAKTGAFVGLIGYGNRLLLPAQDERGYELWTSDGTAAGTVLLKDINPGPSPSYPGPFTTYAGKVFFGADDGTHGRELWVTDGTTPGTTLFLDLASGPASGDPAQLLVAGPYLFFVAAPLTVSGPRALWRTVGTPGGTIELAGTFFDPSMAAFAGKLFYLDTPGGSSAGLWKSDGSPSGTQIVSSIPFPVTPLVRSGGFLYFIAVSPGSSIPQFYELWKSDGTTGGTVLVKGGFTGRSFPRNLTDVNGRVFFVADDGIRGEELWTSDGTPAGTTLVRDIRPGPLSSGANGFLNVGGKLLFRANDGIHGSELWQSDGTEAGTSMVQDINSGPGSSVPEAFVAGGRVFLAASDFQTGRELWSLPMSAVCAAPPTPVITSSRNPSCGDTVTLDAGPGYASYAWSTGESTRTISVRPNMTTTYSVAVANLAGCRSSGSIVQVLDPGLIPPAPSVSNNGPICAGQTLQLNASSVVGGSYSWTGPAGFSSTQQNPQILSAPASASGTYQVVVTLNGCSSPPASTTAVVRPLPSATIAASSVVCFNSTVNIASVSDAGSGATYSWTITNATITSGAGTSTITYTAPASGDVSLGVTVTASSSCSATGNRTVSTAAICGNDFFTLTPCRLIDTRTTDPPALPAGSDRTFVLAGRCGIPSTAKALAVNVVVVAPDSGGHLTLYPAGGALPLASTINYSGGQIRANNAILPLGPNGDLTIHCGQGSGAAHVVLDVNGYFQP